MSVPPAGATEKGCGGVHVVFVDLTASVALLEAAETRGATSLRRRRRARRKAGARSETPTAVARVAHRDTDRNRACRGQGVSKYRLRNRSERASVPRGGATVLQCLAQRQCGLDSGFERGPIGIDLEEARGLTMTDDRRRRVIAAAARLANGPPARRTSTRTGTSFKPGFAWRLRPRRLDRHRIRSLTEKARLAAK